MVLSTLRKLSGEILFSADEQLMKLIDFLFVLSLNLVAIPSQFVTSQDWRRVVLCDLLYGTCFSRRLGLMISRTPSQPLQFCDVFFLTNQWCSMRNWNCKFKQGSVFRAIAFLFPISDCWRERALIYQSHLSQSIYVPSLSTVAAFCMNNSHPVNFLAAK